MCKNCGRKVVRFMLSPIFAFVVLVLIFISLVEEYISCDSSSNEAYLRKELLKEVWGCITFIDPCEK